MITISRERLVAILQEHVIASYIGDGYSQFCICGQADDLGHEEWANHVADILEAAE